MVRIVSDDWSEVVCSHAAHTAPVPIFMDRPNLSADNVEMIVKCVHLEWQVQLDGTIRKVGICPYCGQVYVTNETKLPILEDLTYEQLFEQFKRARPELAPYIVDYRPAGPYALYIIFPDNAIIAQYDPDVHIFNIIQK